ncbi:hypothetical protein [Hymenobacter negativus]|uniref:HEAT repeat domain-containing protein n=2 Tax=Hymenobacter negativus TaxID=2795026 RepID=A0ABS0QCY6_9BACT|nr:MULTISPECIES: hypothetical protein [Bacteria]MBH8560557.1 hypothetical protein [Hymenobacter negativus]MBR7210647.1 hypothetical protein [Microvirga sp. STS02]
MNYSTKWLRLCESEEAYRMRQYDVMQEKKQLALDLEKALVEDNLTALRLWTALEPGIEILMPLLSRVLDLAIDSSDPNKIGLARKVLFQHKKDPGLRNQLQQLIALYLANNDEWNYRRIAELYTHLQYKEEMAAFLVLCRANDNIEIQEISDDYPLI